MCASLGAGDNEHTPAVTELPFSEVRLERRSLLPGYCIVVWELGHIVEPTQLDDDAAAGYWRDVLSVAGAIEARFDPMKINLLTLGKLGSASAHPRGSALPG
jgi:diadenosine tetraphosphate (Ap4A) HIT family hydrolase